MTIEYHVYKAQPTFETVESVVIKINAEVPNFESLDIAREMYAHQAEKLCNILFDTLPGGVFDQLTAAMLLKKASLFKVSHKETENS